MSTAAWMRLATMTCCTIMVIVAGSVAASAARNGERSRWWATVGTLAVSTFIVFVAYELFRSGYYLSYDPA